MLNRAHVIEITKACIVAFIKQEIPWLFDVERRKKTEDGENVFFKAFAKKFLCTSKSCLWPTFFQMGFMKR